MTATSSTETAFFDVLDPQFRVRSPEVRAAAEANWWARTSIGIAVLRYQECVALLRDRRLRHGSVGWLTAKGITSGRFAEWMHSILIGIEGEAHRRLRNLLRSAFTQQRVEILRPFMRSTAHRLVDTFVPTGSCEFMTAFADPYPARIIAELLGIPDEQFDDFLGWANDIGLGFSPALADELDRIEAALAGLYTCCDELVALRRREPGEDLISALVTAADDTGQLTGEELRVLVSTLVFAGQETTCNQLGLAMMTFAEHLDQWRLLGARPELATTAVEEVLRVNPTTPVVGRIAIEDFTFQDVDIPAGRHLALFLATANTEPDTFGDAPFDITAKRTAQLTFGGGIHYCLGACLARIEMREALPILASRLADIALTGPIISRPRLGITGPVTLPLRFATPAGGPSNVKQRANAQGTATFGRAHCPSLPTERRTEYYATGARIGFSRSESEGSGKHMALTDKIKGLAGKTKEKAGPAVKKAKEKGDKPGEQPKGSSGKDSTS